MAVKLVIEPLFEADFVPCSFGFRPEKTPRMALSIIAEKTQAGYSHVVDVDLKSYFDTKYCSLNDPDLLGKIDTTGTHGLAWAQRVATHLALHAARVDSIATRDNPLFENFVKDRCVKGFSLPRGE
jgi:hypothetical protein